MRSGGWAFGVVTGGAAAELGSSESSGGSLPEVRFKSSWIVSIDSGGLGELCDSPSVYFVAVSSSSSASGKTIYQFEHLFLHNFS